MLRKIRSEEPEEDRSTAELDALKHRDWVGDWACWEILMETPVEAVVPVQAVVGA